MLTYIYACSLTFFLSIPIAINVDLWNVGLQVPAMGDVDGLPPEIVFVSKGVDVDSFVDRGECS